MKEVNNSSYLYVDDFLSKSYVIVPPIFREDQIQEARKYFKAFRELDRDEKIKLSFDPIDGRPDTGYLVRDLTSNNREKKEVWQFKMHMLGYIKHKFYLLPVAARDLIEYSEYMLVETIASDMKFAEALAERAPDYDASISIEKDMSGTTAIRFLYYAESDIVDVLAKPHVDRSDRTYGLWRKNKNGFYGAQIPPFPDDCIGRDQMRQWVLDHQQLISFGSGNLLMSGLKFQHRTNGRYQALNHMIKGVGDDESIVAFLHGKRVKFTKEEVLMRDLFAD